VNRALLVQSDSTVKVAGGTEQIHAGLAVVTFVRVVDFGLREEEDLCSQSVPFDLPPISFKERLLAGRIAVEGEKAVNLDACRRAL
jgi:hypothetical protein